MRSSRLPWILLVVVSAIGYGSGSLFAKAIYPTGFDWLDLLVWRHLLAALILGAIVVALPAGRAALRGLTRERALRSFAIGLFFTANAATYVLSIFFAHAPSGPRPWIALAIATTGVVLGVGGIPDAKEPALIGLVLGVASPIIYSCYIILAARLAGETKSGTGASGGGGTSSLAAIPLSLLGTAVGMFVLRVALGRELLPLPIPDGALLPIIGVATIAGIIPIGAFYIGAQRLGAARAALISTVEPIFTIVAAGYLFNESLTAIQLVGGALILGAVLVAEWGAIRLVRPRRASAQAKRGAAKN
ncbi:MAG: DMT family transporter [Chloroflexi bacterium]|nr:DMT family transporter [Chloroflexota bacterium]